MKIDGVVHCFFEQSGVFKNAFRSLGYDAFDYDYEDRFNQVDFQVDLFSEIDKAYNGDQSVFDLVSSDDLSFAFFPCTYFSDFNQTYFTGVTPNFKNLSFRQKIDNILSRSLKRELYYQYALKFFSIFQERSYRLIVEQPFTGTHYLKYNFPWSPSYVDFNRSLRGDKFRKPTQYYFLNCSPSFCFSFNRSLQCSRVNDCSGFSRSEISFDYAISFIRDVVLSNSTFLRQDDLFS